MDIRVIFELSDSPIATGLALSWALARPLRQPVVLTVSSPSVLDPRSLPSPLLTTGWAARTAWQRRGVGKRLLDTLLARTVRARQRQSYRVSPKFGPT